MAEVIRWSTGENMKNNTGERERGRETDTHMSLSRCLAQHSSLQVHVSMYRTALICPGLEGPYLDQHNRCCFEIMGSLEPCRTVCARLLLHHLCI